jgi:hypothetical protein
MSMREDDNLSSEEATMGTHSLNPPESNPWACRVKTWFQSLLFQFLILYRYAPGAAGQRDRSVPVRQGQLRGAVGAKPPDVLTS